tara:strand:- start:788 stop:907 length:120 start_codon:yes stop_codon:yes gene_type:complete
MAIDGITPAIGRTNRLRTFDHYSQAVGEFSNFIIHAHEA